MKRRGSLVLLVLLLRLGASPAAQDVPKARQLLEQALEALKPAPISTATVVKGGANLQAAIDAAPAGAVLSLEPGTYEGAIRLTKPITLQPTIPVAAGRATRTSAPVKLQSGAQTVTISGTDVTLTGLEIRSSDAQQTVVMITGARVLLDRVVVLGDPVKGQHRGIGVNGQAITLRQVFVDDCGLPGRDAQAVSGWDGTDGVLIDDSYLGGGAQSVMFGGADPSAESRIPKHIVIRKSTLSKNPAWYALGWQIKCAFELKDAIDVVVEDSILEYAGISGGSTGYLILLTPRNQGNTAPWATVRQVRFERVLGRYAGGGASLLGSDDELDAKTGVRKTSGPLEDVVFRNVAFENLDPTAGPWKGQGRVFTLNKGPRQVTVDGVTVTGKNLAAGFYIIQKPIALTVRNVKLPVTRYGDAKIDGGGAGWPAVQVLAPDTVLELKPDDVGAVGVPKGA